MPNNPAPSGQHLLTAPFLNVKSFGALGDGVTDDTEAIKAVLAAAADGTELGPNAAGYTWITEQKGGTVYFPRGVYLISSRLIMPDRVSILGDGPAASRIIASTDFAHAYMLWYIDGTLPFFECWINGMSIHANNAAQIQQVVRAESWQERCGMFRSRVEGYQDVGLWLNEGFGGAARSRIIDTDFWGFSGTTAGIHMESDLPNAFILEVNNCTINPSDTATNGILVENGRLEARNLHIERATNGIQFEGGNGIITNLTGASTVTNLITFASGYTGAVEMTGVDVNGGTSAIDDNVTSQDVAGSFTKARFPFRYQFANADTTPSVAQQAPVYRTFNSGATTITDFDNGVPGQRFMLRFQDGNTTIDIGSNIANLDGSTGDITPASGDWMDIQEDGGTWYITYHDATP